MSGGLLAGIVVLLASPEAATRAPAPARDAKVDAAVQKLAPAMVEARHRIHQNPELGNRETKTAELIATHLRALGLEPRTGLAHTGVVANLKGGRPGPYIAVRADMDALPVTEDTPFPFKSTVRATYLGQDVGVSHACGHDIHVAVQMGVVAILAAMKAELPGEIQFIFQPAEEGPPRARRAGLRSCSRKGSGGSASPRPSSGSTLPPRTTWGRSRTAPGPAMAAADALDSRSRAGRPTARARSWPSTRWSSLPRR